MFPEAPRTLMGLWACVCEKLARFKGQDVSGPKLTEPLFRYFRPTHEEDPNNGNNFPLSGSKTLKLRDSAKITETRFR